MAHRRHVKANHSERGAAMVEFALSSIVFIPMVLGAMLFGFKIMRAMQLSQLCRETTHMFAYGTDFTQTQNKAILARLASPINIVTGAGDGAVVLSRIVLVTPSDCQASGLGACANTGKYVFTNFVTFGNTNPSLMQTRLGNPPSNYLSGAQAISPNDILTRPELQATSFPPLLYFPDTSKPNQYAFAGEVTLQPQWFSLPGLPDTGSYVRSFF